MNKQWESDVMKQAMTACLEGKMSMYAAAKVYNVPRTNKFVTAWANIDADALSSRSPKDIIVR